MYDRLVVPTDGSTGTAHVAIEAFELAERYGTRVHLLHVMEDDRGDLLSSGTETRGEQREFGRKAIQPLEEMADVYGMATSSELREGDPSEEILACADEIDADVIVMGTHGRSGIERRLIGSVTERTVRHAPVSVLTVRLPETDRTVTDEEQAAEIVEETLTAEGYGEVTIGGTDRQRSVWVVEATADGTVYNVYVDPVTQRTSSVKRGSS